MPKKKIAELTPELRSYMLRLRLTPTERARWEALAKDSEMSVSEYVRYCVERRALAGHQKIPSVNKQTYWQLSKIGVNLNQMTRAINRATLEGQGVTVDPRKSLEALKRTMTEIMLQLLGQESKP